MDKLGKRLGVSNVLVHNSPDFRFSRLLGGRHVQIVKQQQDDVAAVRAAPIYAQVCISRGASQFKLGFCAT